MNLYKLASTLWKKGRRASIVLVGAFLLAITVASARAANPAPVQIYYISEPEDDVLEAMQDIGCLPRADGKIRALVDVGACQKRATDALARIAEMAKEATP